MANVYRLNSGGHCMFLWDNIFVTCSIFVSLCQEVDSNEIFEYTDANYNTAIPLGVAALKATENPVISTRPRTKCH